nr:hypothetical protein [Tanacetum cinerariifolium]
MWEVIEFGDSYEILKEDAAKASDGSAKKKGRTIAITTEDMQKRKNDVKAKTTLLLSLSDEHQLRFTTKKTKKNLLKQQYGNFKAEGTETLEQTFNRLQNGLCIRLYGETEVTSMSLDDLYNHLKVYESEVQKKSESNSQSMAFISSAKHSSGNEEVNTKTGKKITIQGTDVAGFDKSKVECFNCHKMAHFPRECRALRTQDRKRRDNYRQGSKVEEQTPKALMAIDEVGWDWSFVANEQEDHALIADEEAPT